MSTPFLADGTILQINDGASNAYANVTGVLTITPPAPKVGVYDATALDTAAGSLVKKPLSRSDPGQMSWTMWNDATEYARLILIRGVEKSIKITYPNTKIDTFPVSISVVETGEMQNQDPSKLTVQVDVLGPVVRT
jgi:hypothetical protein